MSLLSQTCRDVLTQDAVQFNDPRVAMAPYPRLFSNHQCIGELWPKILTNRTLKVLSAPGENPRTRTAAYTSDQLNYLTLHSSLTLASLWCPPGFILVFYRRAPLSVDTIQTIPQCRVLPNTILSKIDAANPLLFSDGTSMFLQETISFVVWREYSFPELVMKLCTGSEIFLGSMTEDIFALHYSWYPQSLLCDQYVQHLCQGAHTSLMLQTPPFDRLCDCFTQETQLRVQYGLTNKIPVLCFGKDANHIPERACGRSTGAYQSREMRNATNNKLCSHAECQALIQSINAQGELTTSDATATTVECLGTYLMDIPYTSVSPTTVSTPPSTNTTPLTMIYITATISMWVWYVLGLGLFTAVITIFMLSFITSEPTPPTTTARPVEPEKITIEV